MAMPCGRFNASLTKDPDHPGALFNLGIAYMHLHQWVEAEESTRRYLKSVPDDYRACIRLGMILRELKELEPSIIILQQAAALKETSATAHRELGFSLLEADRWDEACLAFRQALSIKPQSVPAWCGLGEACERKGPPGLALDAYREALRSLEPSSQGPIYVSLGWLYCKLHDWGEARKALEEAIAKGERDPEILLDLGYVLYKAGDYEAALEQARILDKLGADLGERLRTIISKDRLENPSRPESSTASSSISAKRARSQTGNGSIPEKAEEAVPPSADPDIAASPNSDDPQSSTGLSAVFFQNIDPEVSLDGPVTGGVEMNFERASAGQPPSGWDGEYPYASLKVQADSPPEGTLQYLRFEKKEGTGRALFTYRFNEISGVVGIEFDLCCNDKNKLLLGFFVEKDGDFQRSIHTKILRSEGQITPMILLQGESAPYLLGSWVHVKYVVDLIAGRVNGYLDSTHLVHDLMLQANPESLNMLAIHDNINSTGVLLLANIRVYPYVD